MKNLFEYIHQLIQKTNMAARVICLACAIMLWMYVAGTKQGEVTVRVPVDFRNLPASVVLAKKQFKSVTIILSGKNEDIKSVDVKNIRAYVNLENAVPGENLQYPVELNKSIFPDTISVDLSSEKILLNIGKRIGKRVRIVPRIIGTVREGYALGMVKTIPEYVNISGAESQLAKIDAVYTGKIAIDNISRRTIKEINVDSEFNNDVSIDTPRVTVIIPVIESAGLLKVEIHPRIRTQSDRYDFVLKDKNIILYLRPLQEGAELTADDIEAFADVAVPEAGFVFGENEVYIEKSVPVSVVFRNRSKRDLVRPVLTVPDMVVVKITRK